jgi:ribosome-binding factor A
MEDLVARARAADAALAAAREGAQPAGDPDPYRPAPSTVSDDDDAERAGADEPAGPAGPTGPAGRGTAGGPGR